MLKLLKPINTSPHFSWDSGELWLRWQFPLGAFLGSLCLIVLCVLLPDKFKMFPGA
jgi:hypothetical protein